MLDDRVRSVLERLEREDASERERGLPPEQRARQVEPTTGRFLFSFVAPQTDCEVLELGGSRGYSTIWLAAGVRYLGGRVLSLEHDPAKADAWRGGRQGAGVGGWGGRGGGARGPRSGGCPRSRTCSTSSSSTPRRRTTSGSSSSPATRSSPALSSSR